MRAGWPCGLRQTLSAIHEASSSLLSFPFPLFPHHLSLLGALTQTMRHLASFSRRSKLALLD